MPLRPLTTRNGRTRELPPDQNLLCRGVQIALAIPGDYMVYEPSRGGLYVDANTLALINFNGFNSLNINNDGGLTYNTNPVWHDGLYNVSTFIRTTGDQIITGFLDIVGDLVGTRVQSYDGTFYGSTTLANMGPAGFSGANGHVTLRPDGIGSDLGMLDVSAEQVTHNGIKVMTAADVTGYVAQGTTPVAADYGRAILLSGDRWLNTANGISYTYNGSAWISDGSSAPVSSVFGRTGAIVAQTGDYTAAQVGAVPAPVSAGSSATLLRGDGVWSNALTSTFTAVGMVNISSGTPAYYQATSTGGIQSVLSSNDGLGLGFFGTLTAHDLAFVASSGIVMILHADGTVFRPNADNATSLGRAANRLSVVYAATGSINTSDEREKTAVRPFSAAEVAAAVDLGMEIGVFQWLASVAQKGDAARWHIGMTVQRAIAIMESHGLDPFAYGFICYDEWEGTPEQVSEWPDQLDGDGNVICLGGSATTPAVPAGDLYSFRPDGLHAFILRGMAERQTRIEQRLLALEQGA